MADNNEAGSLNWRLSAHPITLLTYLGFRIGRAPFLYITAIPN